MAPTADAADGTDAGTLPKLTPEQQAEIDNTAKSSGKVAAGRAAWDAHHPKAASRPTGPGFVGKGGIEL